MSSLLGFADRHGPATLLAGAAALALALILAAFVLAAITAPMEKKGYVAAASVLALAAALARRAGAGGS